ncbi:MAG: AzlD domain-containing protein [Brachymonas sp.]|nr:AzlD domain-containing protein [Brachymonas sp.]
MNPNTQPGTLFWIALACGIGTFATRLWPMLWHSKGGAESLPPRLRQALAGLGPAAIGALIVASLWSQVAVAQPLLPAARILAALAAIALVRKLAGGTALPTLAGVLVFGALQYLAAA